MKKCTTLEALLKPLSSDLLSEAVRRYDADYYCKKFKLREHLLGMIYGQIHDIKSLRDLEIAFNSQKTLMTCKGIRRSTLSDANNRRPSKCFLWIAEALMTQLPRKKRKQVNQIVRKLDSSPIQLKGRGYDSWTLSDRTLRCQGLKLHVEYDNQLKMPMRAQISRANVDDCSMGKQWTIAPKTIYIFDKGYYDFNWWWKIQQQGSFLVTRLKYNAGIKVVKQHSVESEQILEDSLFAFKNKSPRGGKKNLYNHYLRRIVVKREGKKTPLILVSNLMDESAQTIAQLYKERWEIELFFKWIKQNLRVKKFLGRSENAVKTQIAIALIVYLLIGLFKRLGKFTFSLHQLLIWIKHNITTKKSIYRNLKPPQYKFKKQALSLNGITGQI